jgi:uncharacterized protein YfdQ (DUF2303 family)
MDKSAIEQIQQNPTVAKLLSALSRTDEPVIALPGDYQLESLEIFMAGRSRFRGKLHTNSIGDYARYVTAHDCDGAACFIDESKMTANTIFNLGDADAPGHGDFIASLALKQTAEYQALLKLNGERCTQKDLAEWLEDWINHISFFDGEDHLIDTKRGISAIRKLTIEASRKEDHSAQNFAGSKSTLEKIEASSELGIPHEIQFRCVPYDGLSDRSFKCRLSIITGGAAPGLTVRIKRLEREQQEMADEFRNELTGRFDELKLGCYLGVFSPKA